MREPFKVLTATLGVVLATLTCVPALAAPGPFADPAIAPAGRLAVTNPIPRDPVTIATGKVSGTLLDNGVKAYFGIPFAAPPIRQYRWREPQPVKSWAGVYTANKMPAECVQGLRNNNIDHYFTDEDAAEDCLYLNIWEPGSARPSQKLPVIVWIYGGGFTQGSSSMPVYGGQNIVKKGVIYVAINYRVGVFGFMAHPEATRESGHSASGNWGMLDQVAGLKWVKRNIAAFGGDPANVTILGESAGSMAVNELQASPLAKGLFQKAVGWSGASVAPSRMSSLAEGEADGLKLQAAMKAASLDDMRALSSDKVVAIAQSAGIRTSPIVDGYFLPRSPQAIFEAGDQSDVPIVVGSTTNDLGTDIPVAKAQSLAEFKAAAAAMYGNKASEFLAAYPAANDAEAVMEARRASTEAGLGLGNRDWAKLQATAGHQPAYMYRFDRQEPFVPGVEIADNPQVRGVYHTTDIEYWLQNQTTLNMIHITRNWAAYDRQLSDKMSDILVNFAKIGQPIGQGVGLVRYNPAKEQRTVLGDKIYVEDMNSSGMDFMAANPAARPQRSSPAAATPRSAPANSSY
jgi:para-nitrobenzyl esterase